MAISEATIERVIRSLIAHYFDVNAWAMSSQELATFFRYLPLIALDGIPVPSVRMDAIVEYRKTL